jgi:hypothetical protein
MADEIGWRLIARTNIQNIVLEMICRQADSLDQLVAGKLFEQIASFVRRSQIARNDSAPRLTNFANGSPVSK